MCDMDTKLKLEIEDCNLVWLIYNVQKSKFKCAVFKKVTKLRNIDHTRVQFDR